MLQVSSRVESQEGSAAAAASPGLHEQAVGRCRHDLVVLALGAGDVHAGDRAIEVLACDEPRAPRPDPLQEPAPSQLPRIAYATAAPATASTPPQSVRLS